MGEGRGHIEMFLDVVKLKPDSLDHRSDREMDRSSVLIRRCAASG